MAQRLAKLYLVFCWAVLLVARASAGSEDGPGVIEPRAAPLGSLWPAVQETAAASVPWKAGSARAAFRGGASVSTGKVSGHADVPTTISHPDVPVGRVFCFCVVMYGGVALLWAVFLLQPRAASADGRTELAEGAEQSEEASFFYTGLLCASWASMSVGMHVLNKSLVSSLQAPAVISAVQMIIAVVVMGSMSGTKILQVPKEQLGTWMVIPVLFAGMICSSFYAFSYVSLSLLTVVRNLTPLVALPIESAVMPVDQRPAATVPIQLSVLTIFVGAVVYCDGILVSLSFVGIAYAALNVVMAVSDRVLQRRLLTLECKDMPADVCTVVNNAVGLIPTLLLATATHQLTEIGTPQHHAQWSDPRILVLLLLSGLVGIGICYLGFLCQRAMSATSFLVLGSASKIGVVAAGVVFFGDPLQSATVMGGMFLSLSGSFAYGSLQMASAPKGGKRK